MATKSKKPVAPEAADVRAILDYDPETGAFTWRMQRGPKVAGTVAGYHRPDGYLQIGINGVVYYGHRLAWLHVHGSWPSDQIDHRDGNVQNNRISNLRSCSNTENCQNLGVRKSNTSGAMGVYWDSARSKWKAQIREGGRVRGIGRYPSFEQATQAFIQAKAVAHQFQPTIRGSSL